MQYYALQTPIDSTRDLMKHLMKRIIARPSLALCVALCITTSPAVADDGLGSLEDLLAPSQNPAPARSYSGRVRVFDSVLIHPMPVWSRIEDGAAPAERSRFQRSNQNGIFRFDLAPHEESFKDWSNLLSMVAFQNHPGPIELQAGRLVAHFKTICSPNNFNAFPAGKSPTKRVMVVVCGNYSRNREQGVVAAVTLLKRGNLAVTIMRQWKRKSFITSVTSDWPVTRKEIDGVLGELIKSRLIPATN